MLRSHGDDLNLRSAFLHLVGDAVTSLGVMLSGLIVYSGDWNYADAIVSILVSLWIGREAVGIVRSTVNVLMEGTPEGVEFAEVEEAMLAVPGVKGVHDLHIWSISSSDLALSAHVEVDDAALSETGVLVDGRQRHARPGVRRGARDPRAGAGRRRVRREQLRPRARRPEGRRAASRAPSLG